MKSHAWAYTAGAMIVVALVAAFGYQRAEAHETDGRVFELRTYHAAEGKLDALHARFRDHTSALFVKHGMKLIGFWTPAGGEEANNTLIYVIAHDSREAAQASWRAFSDDPVWQAAKRDSEVDGKLVEKVDSVYMTATDYSPVQ